VRVAFTPGPWLLGPSESPGPYCVILGPPIPNQPFRAAVIAHVYSGIADDRLIVAAPELYEMLRETVAWLEDNMCGGELRERGRAVLARVQP
jgi:hypothetical protein